MRRPGRLSLCAGVALLVLGCQAPPPTRAPNEDRPRCFVEARRLEDDATKEVALGNTTRDQKKRIELYDHAIELMRQARRLYEDELLKDPGTPERERSLRGEIERLDDEIERIHQERPLGG